MLVGLKCVSYLIVIIWYIWYEFFRDIMIWKYMILMELIIICEIVKCGL